MSVLCAIKLKMREPCQPGFHVTKRSSHQFSLTKCRWRSLTSEIEINLPSGLPQGFKPTVFKTLLCAGTEYAQSLPGWSRIESIICLEMHGRKCIPSK